MCEPKVKRRISAQQNKLLRMITEAPIHMHNTTLHRDFQVETLDCFVAHLAYERAIRAETLDSFLVRDRHFSTRVYRTPGDNTYDTLFDISRTPPIE